MRSIIETPSLKLKPLEEKDRKTLRDILTNPKIKLTYMIPDFQCEEELDQMATKLIQLSMDPDRFMRGIFHENSLIGIINDVGIDDDTVELGYAIHPIHQGKGFATEALEGALRELMENGFNSVLCGAFSDNKVSIRVMEKCGMKKISREEDLEYRDKTHHCLYFQISRSKPKLKDMTLEELWQLFPIFLTEHNDLWEQWSLQEAETISDALNTDSFKLTHIGSTAIKGIWAEPIIDFLLEVDDSSMTQAAEDLKNCGYTCMHKENGRMDFNKGYTEEGFAEKVFHLHLRNVGDNDEVYFKDYMNDNPELAKEYEKLKLSLWKKYEHNRNAYTEAKGDFIKAYTETAKSIYKKRNDR